MQIFCNNFKDFATHHGLKRPAWNFGSVLIISVNPHCGVKTGLFSIHWAGKRFLDFEIKSFYGSNFYRRLLKRNPRVPGLPVFTHFGSLVAKIVTVSV
jgi:hypothetical protein